MAAGNRQKASLRENAGRVLANAAPWLGLAAMTALWLEQSKRRPVAGLSTDEAGSPEALEAAHPGRGRLASHPHHIPWTGWRDILWRTYREINADRLPAVAGGVTFYGLLAIFPAIGVFVSLYGLVADIGQVSMQLSQLAAFVPQDVLAIVGDQMIRLTIQRDSSLSVAFVVSLLLSLWSANAGMAALFDGLNIAYDEEEKRHMVLRRALTLGFTFALLVFGAVVTGLLVGVPLALTFAGLPRDALWLIPFRWLVLMALAAAALAVLYRFAPSRSRPRWRWVWLGAAFASVVWIGGSLAFSWYVNNIAHFDATYGSLAAVIGFMMWIWFSAMVILLGAELNAEVEHQTAMDSTVGAPVPMGARGAAMADTVGMPFDGFRKLIGDVRSQVSRIGRRGR